MKSVLAFTALSLFAISLLLCRIQRKSRHSSEHVREQNEFRLKWNETAFRSANIVAWTLVGIYAFFEASSYASEGEEFDAVMSILFLIFSIVASVLFVIRWSENAKSTFTTLTKVALIASIVYFPFAEIKILNDFIIYGTTLATSHILNFFMQTYVEHPASIFTTSSAFHEKYGPIEIILACTAIQSIALFAGLTLGVSAPAGRRIKAFLVSVPVIYVLNLFRNVFVCAAYFENWFGEWFGCSPLGSFSIAHDYIARFLTLVSLFIIAYAVFTILPEALNFVDDCIRLIRNRH